MTSVNYNLTRPVPLTAVKIGEFRPLPEPIRLQDLVHLARSRAEKKIKDITQIKCQTIEKNKMPDCLA